MGAAPSKKDVSLSLKSVGVINIFPDPSPAVRNNNQPCTCNHNHISKKEIPFPPPPPHPSPSPSPDSFVYPESNSPDTLCSSDDNNNISKKKETKSSESNSIMNPGVFSDFGKQANDLLMKDYYNKDMDKDFFTLGTHSNAGVDLTLTTFKKKKDTNTRSSVNGFSMGNLTASYKSKNNKNNSIHFKIINNTAEKSNNGFSTSTQVQFELVPDIMNVFMSMEYPDLNRGDGSKVGCQFFVPDAYLNLTATSTLGDEIPILASSATMGTPDFAIGGDVVSDSRKCGFNYRAGIRLTNSIFDLSTVVSDDTAMKVSCVHPLNLKNKSYVVAEIKKNKLTDEAPATLTVGTSFQVNHPWKDEMKTVVKAKFDNHGNMGLVLQQQLIDDKLLQICSEFDTMAFNKTPRIGVSLCSIES